MSDVRIMKKIIIQIYNNLQVPWSSKVKFVSLSQLLGCSLFVSHSGLFTFPGFIVSFVGLKKKKKKEKMKPPGFKLAKLVLLVFLAAANSGGLAHLFSVWTSIQAASCPNLQQLLDPQVQALTLLRAMGLCAQEGSLP